MDVDRAKARRQVNGRRQQRCAADYQYVGSKRLEKLNRGFRVYVRRWYIQVLAVG
jgi:hypothetical protein